MIALVLVGFLGTLFGFILGIAVVMRDVEVLTPAERDIIRSRRALVRQLRSND